MRISAIPGYAPAFIAGAILSSGCSRPDAPRPNILLITLDTTRADHLGCYGHVRPTSPELDRLARQSVRYTNAYSPTSWTLPAHASLFTGKFPSAHGATHDPEGKLRLSQGIVGDFDGHRAQPIADDEITLASILARHGWATGGIAGGPWMKRVFRLDRGFDFYDDDHIDDVNGRSAADITAVAKDFIDRQEDAPFFLFLNYYDPHGPFRPEPAYLGKVVRPGEDPRRMTRHERARLAYDAEIRYMDDHLGELLRHLRTKGLFENTWIIVTADHGELLGDTILGGGPAHGHGHSLSEAEIHVPLIVKYPGTAPRRGTNDTPVQLTDVLPTLLDALSIPAPPDIQGRSFDDPERGPIFAEVYPLHSQSEYDWRLTGDWRVLFEGSYKFGWNSLERHFLVNVAEDPGEENNIGSTDPIRIRRIEARMQRLLRSFPAPGSVATGAQVDAATTRSLQQLGYLGEEHLNEE
ncbi:MAG: hypothetical protein CMJ89_14405 [Planctomycetes bacterium]|jgi:arylsulfatase A-like enzyme|nr:hypothetical protein [Planctomycetota bacterium]